MEGRGCERGDGMEEQEDRVRGEGQGGSEEGSVGGKLGGKLFS